MAWRKTRHGGTILGLAPKKQGRKPARRNPLEKRVHQLEGEVARLEKAFATAKTILELQRTVAGLLGLMPAIDSPGSGNPNGSPRPRPPAGCRAPGSLQRREACVRGA